MYPAKLQNHPLTEDRWVGGGEVRNYVYNL